MSNRGVTELADYIDRAETAKERAESAAVQTVQRHARCDRMAPAWADDAIRTVAPPVYVEALTGLDVPSHGGMVRCPLPDHADRRPSCMVYPAPDRGWYCFGCARGGDVYNLTAALWGLQTRGPGFVELRQRIARELLGTAA